MTERTGGRTVSATFPSEPRAVRSVRSFVGTQMAQTGRSEFVEPAALAVTELATNVVLHARTEFTVSVTAVGDDRVRISVRDASTVLPLPQIPEPGAALGRGLHLVAQVTAAWGVERTDVDDVQGPGKAVWFELGAEPVDRATSKAALDPAVAELLTVNVPSPEAFVDVKLLRMPLQLFGKEVIRHRELMREMALIAFGDETPTTHVPAALTQLASELEQYRGVGAATDAVRDAATARGDASVDLEYLLPPAVGPACRRLNDLLDEAEDYCRDENLLTLAATATGLRLRQWYLCEIANQIDGAPARRWTGPLD